MHVLAPYPVHFFPLAVSFKKIETPIVIENRTPLRARYVTKTFEKRTLGVKCLHAYHY